MKTISLPSRSPLTSSDFLYGVATSSYQIEGGAEARDPCIWDTFCEQPGAIKDGTHGRIACDHYHRWEEDIEQMRQLGVDAYRFSLSWPRIIRADGSVNQAGVDFYLNILKRLNAVGIKPFITLYHWDLPQSLEDKGGWLNRQTAYAFADYTQVVVKAFEGKVHSYATLNEPFCSAHLGYELGIHAPGLTGQKQGRQAAHHLLLAHGLAMQVLNQHSPETLNGIVLNFTPCYPATDNAADTQAATLADEYINQWYLKPVLDGEYPPVMEHLDEENKPVMETGDMAIIQQPLDFLGVNFYTRLTYAATDNGWFEELPHREPRTNIGWEIFPQAFTDLLITLNQNYALPPVYITENGAAMDDTAVAGRVEDEDRIRYYQQHLEALHNAVEAGVDVRGYFAWSLMDNFEWAEGYRMRFGLLHVDYDTQVRTPKASADAYRDFIATRQA